MIEISSKIVPYTDPDEFWERINTETTGYKMLVQTNEEGTVDFSGKYGSSLMDEIYKYSVVASVIAEENEFDYQYTTGLPILQAFLQWSFR